MWFLQIIRNLVGHVGYLRAEPVWRGQLLQAERERHKQVSKHCNVTWERKSGLKKSHAYLFYYLQDSIARLPLPDRFHC
jgi:hypothetical protein